MRGGFYEMDGGRGRRKGMRKMEEEVEGKEEDWCGDGDGRGWRA